MASQASVQTYSDTFCQAFTQFPSALQPNTSGMSLTLGSRRQSVRDGIRNYTRFRLDDFSGSSNNANSAFANLAVGNCCSDRVLDSMTKLKNLVTWGGQGSDVNNLGMWQNCVYNYPDSTPNDSEKKRISRYCREMAANYYNELYSKWVMCKNVHGPSQVSAQNTQTSSGEPGCTDETAVNFKPTATYDDGSCEYNLDRPQSDWGLAYDSQGNQVSLVNTVLPYGGKPTTYTPTTYTPTTYTPTSTSGYDSQGNPVSYPNQSPSWLSTFLENLPQGGKPTSTGTTDMAQYNMLADRVNQLQSLIVQAQSQPQAQQNSGEVEMLRSELQSLQMMMMNQPAPQPAPSEAGMGNLPVILIVGGLALTALIVVMNKKKASAPTPSPTPYA